MMYSKCPSQFIADQRGAALITIPPLWGGLAGVSWKQMQELPGEKAEREEAAGG